MKRPKYSDNTYVIAYDIRKDRTRRKVADILVEAGLSRVNKSVYEGKIRQKQFSKIIRTIYDKLSAHDCIVAYPVSPYSIMKKQVLRKKKPKDNENGPIII